MKMKWRALSLRKSCTEPVCFYSCAGLTDSNGGNCKEMYNSVFIRLLRVPNRNFSCRQASSVR
jgi:hypothetical protein